MRSDVTVVVGTLDLYKDVWGPLCAGISKYWPDCPWPIQFITNNLEAPCGKTIKVGGNRTEWSKRIRRGLSQIESPVILWLTGDNWMTAPPDTKALLDFAGHVRVKKAVHIRLCPEQDHGMTEGSFSGDPRLVILSKRAPYRTSLKPGFYRRSVYLGLLKEGEEPWDFERNAPKRSRRLPDLFLAVKDWGHFPFVVKGDPFGDWIKSPVVRGRWTTSAKMYAEREGLKIDFSKHPVKEITDDKLRREVWLLP